MTPAELEQRLAPGGLYGCRKETANPALLGWITIIRRKIAAVPPVEPERFAEWQSRVNHVQEYPSLLRIYEVDAQAYHAETTGLINSMAPEDYRE